jgi:hypothetical protein
MIMGNQSDKLFMRPQWVYNCRRFWTVSKTLYKGPRTLQLYTTFISTLHSSADNTSLSFVHINVNRNYISQHRTSHFFTTGMYMFSSLCIISFLYFFNCINDLIVVYIIILTLFCKHCWYQSFKIMQVSDLVQNSYSDTTGFCFFFVFFFSNSLEKLCQIFWKSWSFCLNNLFYLNSKT